MVLSGRPLAPNMATRLSEEMLYDSEATLRLVDTVLDELQELDAAVSRSEDRVRVLSTRVSQAHSRLEAVPEAIALGSSEIRSVLDSLRQTREILESAELDRFQQANDKLQEVTTATEVATHEIMDSLDRSLLLLERLDEADAAERAEVQSELREELFGVVGSLQIQEITSQQLRYASNVLLEMEGRLVRLAQSFEPVGFAARHPISRA